MEALAAADTKPVASPLWRGTIAIVLIGLILQWLVRDHTADLPAIAPWDFFWSEYLAIALAGLWYARGVNSLAAGHRPALWRQIFFWIGIALIYAVLLTRFEYMAQHMFFLNRLQHMVMHHLAPFLIALAWPGEAILQGMPASLRQMLRAAWLRHAMRVLQHPIVAGLLFVGLINLWLIPAVHFRAMLNTTLYELMNWSMVADGLLFWCLVLDPRNRPAARISFGIRMLVVILVMFPQILSGSWLAFSTRMIYPYYDLCGRLYPSIGALSDQHYGGLIVWIPSAMMSSLAFMLILNHLRIEDERMAALGPPAGTGPLISSSAWTGR